ncbi:MAG: carboxymuconolactone decarboxylase family protein, partial [Rhizobiales bacterium]|nr:carboxymuconolactone decarboxylase family protein [Hyphomicrobiales bacterium]
MLRYGTSFPPRLSELAILVTAHHYQCALEWHFHEKPARDAGLSDDIIEDLRLGRTPTIDDDDALDVYRFSRELHSLSRVGEASYAAVLDRWGVVGVVELTALIGYYTMVAMTLNTHAY